MVFLQPRWNGRIELKYNGHNHVAEFACEFDSRQYTEGCEAVYDAEEGSINMWVDVKSAMSSDNLDSLLKTADTLVLSSEGWEMVVRHRKNLETHDGHGLCMRLLGTVVSIREPSKLDEVLAEA